jgi:hypothetical protein
MAKRSTPQRSLPGPVHGKHVRCGEVVALKDLSSSTYPAARLFGLGDNLRAAPQYAHLAHQFVAANLDRLAAIGVTSSVHYDGGEVGVVFEASSTVGAVPLRSPLTGRSDVGAIVEPRFEWPGVGRALAATGWRVTPSILGLPMLPRSARNIPLWLLATTVLGRIERLLDVMTRGFEVVEEVLPAPRGSVRWAQYATAHMTRGRPDRIPCRFPSLQQNRQLLGAIHWTLRQQLMSLEGERTAGPVVLRVIEWCQGLLQRVSSAPPHSPGPHELEAWLRLPVVGEPFRSGIEAIEWTVEERGLAGVCELQGLPWAMSMAEFWEAWVESLASRLVRISGGRLRVGRRGETVTPIAWEPASFGSQRSLVPDIIWERAGHTVIFDAKYKRHWSELQGSRWVDLDEVTREHHRDDLLQILAYANLPGTERVTLVLAYPCYPGRHGGSCTPSEERPTQLGYRRRALCDWSLPASRLYPSCWARRPPRCSRPLSASEPVAVRYWARRGSAMVRNSSSRGRRPWRRLKSATSFLASR